MSPVRRPSSVEGLRRGVGVAPPAAPAAPVETAPPVAEATGTRPRPERPVRFTLDLDRERHAYLKQYAAQIEAKASEVVRELLDEMRNDGDLRTRVRTRIWQKGQSR